MEKFDCFKSKAKDIGEVLDVLGDVQCSIVSKGKRYYLPILVGDWVPYAAGQTWKIWGHKENQEVMLGYLNCGDK